jgi:translation initiation factor 2B subunit (eIF-2B alpha/beta/delta family)
MQFFKITLFLLTTTSLSTTATSTRDPFFVAQKSMKIQRPKDVFILQGIMQKKGKFGAIIKNGDSSELVFQNDKIGHYIVKKIKLNEIILTHGKNELKLFIE